MWWPSSTGNGIDWKIEAKEQAKLVQQGLETFVVVLGKYDGKTMGSRLLLFATLSLFTSSTFAGLPWHEFKGIYVGMNADQAKKLGLSCQPPSDKRMLAFYDEHCIPKEGNERFTSIGGEKIKEFEVAIFKGKVNTIYIKTAGRFGGGLEEAMTKHYGKPKQARGSWMDGTFEWRRGGAELIRLSMDNGVNIVAFHIATSIDDSDKLKKKSEKDF
jgi:hypothetical protein